MNIFVDSPMMDHVVNSLKELPDLEEMYEVTGEFDVVCLVSANDIEEFRDILKNRVMKIKGVKSTVTSVVLHSHKGPRTDENMRKAARAPGQ